MFKRAVVRIIDLFKQESVFDSDLLSYRQRADSIALKVLVFMTGVCLLAAAYRATWLEWALLALPTLGLGRYFVQRYSGSWLNRLYMSIAFMVYTGLLIHQSGGDIEAHFAAFGLIGVLLYYRDWRTIFFATVFIYLHHLVLGLAQVYGVPFYVFDSNSFWALFALHVAYFLPFVGMMAYLSIWLRRDAYAQQSTIAQLRENEAQLVSAKKTAEDVSSIKTRFLANMSHEMRTPLNGVMGMLQIVLGEEGDKDVHSKNQDYLRQAYDSAGFLLSIINDLLDYTALESGKVRIVAHDFNLHTMLQNTLDTLSPLAKRKGLRMGLEIQTGVPVCIRSDALRLRQVLTNLVGNAIKFTEAGFIHIKVEVAGHNQLTFQVQDTGIGLDMGQAERIFSPFEQADSSQARVYQGTGLGLSISRALVQKLGGSLAVKSALGRGATFFFDIFVEDSGAECCTLHPKVEKTAFVPLHILLVEDQIVNQKVAQVLLAQMGHTVETVNDGLAALKLLEQRYTQDSHHQVQPDGEQALAKFDLILLDLMMPGMDGLTLLSLLRTHRSAALRDLYIVLLTAHAMAGDEARFMEYGPNGYLTKPLVRLQLQEVLDHLQQERLPP